MPGLAEDARIRRLRLAAAEDCRGAVRAALDDAEWWRVAAPGEVLLLRRVRVSGALSRVGPLALQEASRLAAGAVDGWSSEADRAAAVRFASRAAMLACLLRDLLAGRARERWFWRAFADLIALPPGRALPRLLASEVLLLPAIVARLEGGKAWPRFWQALDHAGALQVLAAVQRATGWQVAVAETGPDSAMGSPAAQPVPALPAAWRAALPMAIDAEDGRLRLALVIRLWQTRPRLLADAPRVIRALAGLAVEAGPPAAGVVGVLPPGAVERGQAPLALPGREAVADSPPGAKALREMLKSAPRADVDEEGTDTRAFETGSADDGRLEAAYPPQTSSPPAGQQLPAQGQASGPDPAATMGESLMPEPVGPTGVDAGPNPVHPDELRLLTRRGGWFLLLNVLALPKAQERLATEREVPGLAAGWVWLYRLGRALGAEPDAALAQFLAREAGLDDAEALHTLSPLRCEPDLLRLARARYGEGLLDDRLTRVPALALATRSHVDVHYRLGDARLDVRRVALDIDPGWLPWLGRVVKFHYGEPSELAGIGDEETAA